MAKLNQANKFLGFLKLVSPKLGTLLKQKAKKKPWFFEELKDILPGQ